MDVKTDLAHHDFGHFYGSSYVAGPDGSRTPVSKLSYFSPRRVFQCYVFRDCPEYVMD